MEAKYDSKKATFDPKSQSPVSHQSIWTGCCVKSPFRVQEPQLMSLNFELGQMIQLSASDDGLLWAEKIGTGD